MLGGGEVNKAYPIQQLAERCSGSGLVVCQEAARQVWKCFFDNGIVRIHPQGCALNDSEGPQDESKVGGDVNGVIPGQLIQRNGHLRNPTSTPVSCVATAMLHTALTFAW